MSEVLTTNVLLILKVSEIIFFSRAKHIKGILKNFEGAETFLTSKLSPVHSKWQFWGQKVEAPSKIARNAPLYFLPQTKNNLLHFQNQRYVGILCPRKRKRERELE
jgi:hypothetical protein